MNRILVATDGSEGASRAVDRAARLSSALGAELLIATVGLDRLSAAEISEAAREGISQGDLLERFAQEILIDAKKLARSQGAPEIRTLHALGDPAQTILDLARGEQVDMIVVQRHGRGRLAGLLLGSVSHKLARLAPCTVVLVP
jgi:nucleotide-binding universal stress UspA family protein